MNALSHIFKFPSRPSKPKPEPEVPIVTLPKMIKRDVNPIGMSYWRNINCHSGKSELLLFLSIEDQLHVLTIDKRSLEIKGERALGIAHTGEGCYFSATKHDILFVPLNGELRAVNVITGDEELIWKVDGHKLWQIHSSFSEKVHSATLRNENDYIVGWAVFRNGETIILPVKGQPDECQIDKSGNWLLIKEDQDNRILRIADEYEFVVKNQEGALGHSDCGFGMALGENDYSGYPGALDSISFDTGEKRHLYSTGIWNMGYVSYTGINQFCLLTTPTQLIKVWLNGGVQILCSNFNQSDTYEHRAKANLCPLGEFAAWTAYVEDSIQAYIVRV